MPSDPQKKVYKRTWGAGEISRLYQVAKRVSKSTKKSLNNLNDEDYGIIA